MHSGVVHFCLVFLVCHIAVSRCYARETVAGKGCRGIGCPNDPDVNRNVTELITSKGYPCEEYTVQTEDGFLLGVQRIPHGRHDNRKKSRPVVFLQHGLLCASTNWVTNLANESLGFLLADAGFDVWLGNMRGNTYSRKHTKYSPSSDQFWAWSWDEMAKYDLPAMVDFALQKSGQKKLFYIGHSQGTLISFAQLSHDKELSEKIHMFLALGPVATVGHTKSEVAKFLAFVEPAVEYFFKIFGFHDFLPNNDIIHFLADTFCNSPIREVCSDFLFLITGSDAKQMNQTRLPVYLHHSPAGTSVQNMRHFAQMVRSGLFQRFDYGSKETNMKHYGQATPPLYYPGNITVPTALFFGEKDLLADPQDVNELAVQIKHLYLSEEIPEWDHLDFIWGLDAATVLYDKIIKIMKINPIPLV